jgi:hypothetical protein
MTIIVFSLPMKRTLDQLDAHFCELEKEKRDAEVSSVLDSHIRPHVLNLDNWTIDDMNKVHCAPILIDKPEGCGERYQVYNQAWMIMSGELLANNSDPAYQVSWGGSSWDITPNISYKPGRSLIEFTEFNGFEENRKSKKRITRKRKVKGESAETIYKKTFERLGTDFVEVIQKEAERLVAFLSNTSNWIDETRTSKPFAWNDPLKYTCYDSYKEVKRLALLQLETERLTLEFRDAGCNLTEAKIIGVKKRPNVNTVMDSDSDI